MPKTEGGGGSIPRKKASKLAKRVLRGPKTHPIPAARSKALVVSGNKTYRKATEQVLARKAGVAKSKKAKKYLAKSSGTTTGEVKGVLKAVRSGKMSKGGAIKALKGGPTAGVPAGNKKKVAKAIRVAKNRKYRAL